MMFDVILLTVCLALKVTTTCDFRRKMLDWCWQRI
jgi:hypothetical protein